MNYIKYVSNNVVLVGGQVVTSEMLEEGWFEFNGDIPPHNTQLYELNDNVLTPHIPELPISEKVRQAQIYLNITDHKMLQNYVPKEDEDIDFIINQRNAAREFIRANKSVVNYSTPPIEV